MAKRWRWIAVACALVLGAVLAVTAQACGPSQAILLRCPNVTNGLYDPPCCGVNGTGCSEPCVNPHDDLAVCCKEFDFCRMHTDPDPVTNCKEWFDFWCATPDADADAATIDGATGCAGDCVPLPPLEWQGPVLLRFGDPGAAPACPSNAPVTAYQGHAGLVVPDGGTCTACTCSIDGGACDLPATLTAGSGTCADAGTFTAALDLPADWDGGCTGSGAIAANASCEGSPCAVSITAGALVLTPPGCEPSAATLDAGATSWQQATLACRGDYPGGACGDLGLVCAPSAAQAPGFRTCIFHEGDVGCPEPYAERHVVYAGVDDGRGCAPCTCGAPDSACSATLRVFGDDEGGGLCTKPKLIDLVLSAAGPTCGDLPDAGLAIGSERVVALEYDAGLCAPGGGEPVGEAAPAGPATFCCLARA